MQEQSLKQQQQAAKVIWFAMIGALFIYGYLLQSSGRMFFTPLELDPVSGVLLGLGLAAPAIGYGICRMMLARAKDSGAILAASLIGWALSETGVIFGLVLSFIKSNGWPYVGMLVYSLLFFFLLRPKDSALKV